MAAAVALTPPPRGMGGTTPLRDEYIVPRNPTSPPPRYAGLESSMDRRVRFNGPGYRTAPILRRPMIGLPRSGPPPATWFMSSNPGGAPVAMNRGHPLPSFTSSPRRRAASEELWYSSYERSEKKGRKNAKKARAGKSKNAKGKSGFMESLNCSKKSKGKKGKKGAKSASMSGKFYDGFRQISIDSMSDDWDLPVSDGGDYYVNARNGPVYEKAADDMEITMQDLFPCLASVFTCCGKPKKRRALVRPREVPHRTGPQLETVCLECGNVLEHRHLPDTVMKDLLHERYDWNKFADSSRGIGADGDYPGYRVLPGRDSTYKPPPEFDGYRGWRVLGDSPNPRRSHNSNVPLPAFTSGPPRAFCNKPGAVDITTTRGVIPDSDFLDADQTGRVPLPEFAETRKPSLHA